MRKTMFVILLVVLALTIVACGGGDAAGGGAVEAGEKLFSQSIIGSQAGCSTCHSLKADEVIVGPSLAGIGSRSDEAAIRTSILDPEAVLVDGFPPSTMPQVWGDELSDEDLDNIVAYLLTLK